MSRLCKRAVLPCLVFLLLMTESSWARRGGGSSSGGKRGSSSSKWGSSSKPSSSLPNRNSNPYPSGGSYPGVGNSNPGGYPKQNPASYPGAGNAPNQNPGRAGYPNQNPAGGYPNQNPAGGYPNQNPAGGYPHGGYPNQNPGAGGYPAGGYPNQNNPARGGYPNQNPGAGGYPHGGYPNQNPGAGGYPAGGYPNQNNPARGGYPNQNPGVGGYPHGGYPNQNPGVGGYPHGGYPNQNPGGYPAGGFPNQRSPYQYPGAGGYPVRTGNTGQGWGQPGAYPGYNPGGGIGGYPNWNPNNKILSPSYAGGGYVRGMGGSPFSQSVQSMGYKPQSSGFAKKAVMAAGVGAVAGMALGYGLGRFPRPHFSFRNPEEEYYYNNYMYRRYGVKSTDEKDYGRDFVYKPPPRAEKYDAYMEKCMNRTDLLKDQGKEKGDDDTVSIEEIGYPLLIEQMKARKCVELYMEYSAKFLEEQKPQKRSAPGRDPGQGQGPMNRCHSLSDGAIQLFTSLLMLCSMLLLQ